MPGLRKDGYEERYAASPNSPHDLPPHIWLNSTTSEPVVQPTSSPSTSQPSRPSQPQPSPLSDPSRPFSLPSPSGSRNPLEIGRSDLEPGGGALPNPFAPPSMFPGSGGDGMYVGPSHPMFRDRMDPMRGGAAGVGGVGGRGPWGGDGFLPPMGAPPGARFDPVGPFGRGGPGGFPGGGGGIGPGGGGAPPRRGFGPGGGGGAAGPDNDEFMPPGSGYVSVTRSSDFTAFRMLRTHAFSVYRMACIARLSGLYEGG